MNAGGPAGTPPRTSHMTGSISGEGTLKKLLQHMNNQVPSRRPKLSELLAMAEPHYVGRDGAEYLVSKEELRSVRAALDHLGIGDIRLPLILMADSSQQQSSWRVEGEVECALVLHLLGKANPERKDRVFLYVPLVAELRRIVPTTTVCMFMP